MTGTFALCLLACAPFQEPSSIKSFDDAKEAQLRDYRLPGGGTAPGSRRR